MPKMNYSGYPCDTINPAALLLRDNGEISSLPPLTDGSSEPSLAEAITLNTTAINASDYELTAGYPGDQRENTETDHSLSYGYDCMTGQSNQCLAFSSLPLDLTSGIQECVGGKDELALVGLDNPHMDELKFMDSKDRNANETPNENLAGGTGAHNQQFKVTLGEDWELPGEPYWPPSSDIILDANSCDLTDEFYSPGQLPTGTGVEYDLASFTNSALAPTLLPIPETTSEKSYEIFGSATGELLPHSAALSEISDDISATANDSEKKRKRISKARTPVAKIGKSTLRILLPMMGLSTGDPSNVTSTNHDNAGSHRVSVRQTINIGSNPRKKTELSEEQVKRKKKARAKGACTRCVKKKRACNWKIGMPTKAFPRVFLDTTTGRLYHYSGPSRIVTRQEDTKP